MKILTTPHPSLSKTAKPVVSWTPKLQKQLKQMTILLQNARNPEGIGLAATQVGINKRFFIILDNNKRPQVFTNPKITKTSTKMLSDKYKNQNKRPLEGCLSIPKIWGFVDRPYSITLQYQNCRSSELLKSTQNFKDIDAISIQHELDHLNGILFTDHILKQNGTIYKQTRHGLTPLTP